jgi:hypothetical protein
MKPAFAVPPRIISLPAALHSNSVKPVACRKASNHRATSLFPAQRASFRLAPSPISQRTQSFHALLIRPTGSCHSQFRACAGSFIAPAAATLSFLVHHRLFWVRIAACVCVCLFSSSLPRPSPHQNTYSHSHFSLSFTSHHRPLPHLTSNLTFYPLSFRCYSYPLVASLFALAFSLPKFDIGLIPPFAPKRDFGSSGSLGIPLRIAVADIFSNFIHRRHLLALFSCSFRTRLDWGSGK